MGWGFGNYISNELCLIISMYLICTLNHSLRSHPLSSHQHYNQWVLSFVCNLQRHWGEDSKWVMAVSAISATVFPHTMNALHKGTMLGERVFNPHFNSPSGGCSTNCIVCQCVTEACGCPTDDCYLVGVCSLL